MLRDIFGLWRCLIFQSTLSGPNQLGLWLLIPFSICLVRVFAYRKAGVATSYMLSLIVFFLAIALTFSRSAWIATGVLILVYLYHRLHRSVFLRMSAAFGILLLLVGVAVASLAPGVVLRMASSKGHIEKPAQAIQTMIQHPLGLGLGSAGPASNRTSDTCVMLESGADASWAQAHPNLCVFIAETQVQPMGKVCNCPFLTENWYLQIGVELGWLGMGLFIGLVVIIMRTLRGELRSMNYELRDDRFLMHVTLLVFLGIGIASLFLHAWEDAAVAYTLWMLIGVAIPVSMLEKKSNRPETIAQG
jgi:hypothetical protein